MSGTRSHRWSEENTGATVAGDRVKPRLALRLANWDYRLETVEGGILIMETWSFDISPRLRHQRADGR